MFEEQRHEQSNQQLHDIVSVLVEIYHAIIDTNNILTQNISAKLTSLQSGLTSIAHGLSSITQGLSAIHDAVRTVHTTVQQIRASVSQTRQETPQGRGRSRDQGQQSQIPPLQLPQVSIPQTPNITTPQPRVSQHIEQLRQSIIQQEQLQRERQYISEQLAAILKGTLESKRVASGSISIHPERIFPPPGATSIAPGVLFQALTSSFGIKLARIKDKVDVQGLIQGTIDDPLQQLLLLPVLPKTVRGIQQFTSKFSPAKILSLLANISGLHSDRYRQQLAEVISNLSTNTFSFSRNQLLEASLALRRSLLRGEQLLPPDFIERIFSGQIDHHAYYRLLASVFTAGLPLTDIPRELRQEVKQIRRQLVTQIKRALRGPQRHGEPPEVEHIAKSLVETHGGGLLSFVSSFIEKPQSTTQPFYTAHDILSLERIVKDLPGVPEGYSFILTKKVLSLLSSLSSYHKHGQPEEVEYIASLIESSLPYLSGSRSLSEIHSGLEQAIQQISQSSARHVPQLTEQRIAAFRDIASISQSLSTLSEAHRELIARRGLLLYSEQLTSPSFDFQDALNRAVQELQAATQNAISEENLREYLTGIYQSATQLHPLQLPYIYRFLLGAQTQTINVSTRSVRELVSLLRSGTAASIQQARSKVYSEPSLQRYLQTFFPEALLPILGLQVTPTQDINELARVFGQVKTETGARAEDLQTAFQSILQLYSEPYTSVPGFRLLPRKQAFDLFAAARLHSTQLQNLYTFLTQTPSITSSVPPVGPPSVPPGGGPPPPHPRDINIYGPVTINCNAATTISVTNLTVSAQNVTLTAQSAPQTTPTTGTQTTPTTGTQTTPTTGTQTTPTTGTQTTPTTGTQTTPTTGTQTTPTTGTQTTPPTGTQIPPPTSPPVAPPQPPSPTPPPMPTPQPGSPPPLGLPSDVWSTIYRAAERYGIKRMLQERRIELVTPEAAVFAARHAMPILERALGPDLFSIYQYGHHAFILDESKRERLSTDIMTLIGTVLHDIIAPAQGLPLEQAHVISAVLRQQNWPNALRNAGIIDALPDQGGTGGLHPDFSQFIRTIANTPGLTDYQRFQRMVGYIYGRLLRLYGPFRDLFPNNPAQARAASKALYRVAQGIAIEIPKITRGIFPSLFTIPEEALRYILGNRQVLDELLATQRPEHIDRLLGGVGYAFRRMFETAPSPIKYIGQRLSALFALSLYPISQEPISAAASHAQIQEQLMAFSKSLLYAIAAVFGFSKAVNRIAQGFPFHQIGYAIAYPTRLYSDVEFMSRNLDKMIEYNERMNELYAQRLEAREFAYDIVTKMSLTVERLYTEPISRITSIIGRREFLSDLLSAGILSGASLALASMVMKNIGMPIGPSTAGLILAATFPLFMRTTQTESVLQGIISSTATTTAAYLALKPEYMAALGTRTQAHEKLTERQYRYAKMAGVIAPFAFAGAEVIGMAGLPYTASTVQSISSSALALSYGALVKGNVPTASHVIGASIAALGIILSTAIAEALGQQKIAQIIGNIAGMGFLGYAVAFSLYGTATAGIIGAIIGAAIAGAVHLVSWLTEKPRDLLSIANQMKLPGDEPRK